jgi:hypothetical protein
MKMKHKNQYISHCDRFHNYRVRWKYACLCSKKYSKNTRPRRTMTLWVWLCPFILFDPYVSLLLMSVIQKLQDNLHGMFDPLIGISSVLVGWSCYCLIQCSTTSWDYITEGFFFHVVLLLRLHFWFLKMIFIAILKLEQKEVLIWCIYASRDCWKEPPAWLQNSNQFGSFLWFGFSSVTLLYWWISSKHLALYQLFARVLLAYQSACFGWNLCMLLMKHQPDCL